MFGFKLTRCFIVALLHSLRNDVATARLLSGVEPMIPDEGSSEGVDDDAFSGDIPAAHMCPFNNLVDGTCMTPMEIADMATKALFVDFDAEAGEKLLAPNYIQHNPTVPTGAAALLGLLPALQESGFGITIHRALQEGNLVAYHATFTNATLLGGQTFFKNEYQMPIEKRHDEVKTKKLNAIIRPFILRRLKSQVATDLPEKVENIYYTNMSVEQEKKYEEAKSFYRHKILDQIDKEGINSTRMMILEGLTKLRQLSNHPKMIDPRYEGDSGKLEDVSHMLENALLEGHKVLVFSQFVKHLDIVKEMLKDRKIPFAYLDGSSNDRKEQVEKFNKDPYLKVFLISIKAGGLGLNLTEADYVFILDPWWNPAVEAQATDRAHRIGQKKKVFSYKFITRNTVEEKILTLQKHKLKLSENLIQNEENVIKSLSREDIEMLLN